MPEFAEIFQTKEALATFTNECTLLMHCNTSVADAKEFFVRTIRAVKAICEVVKPHDKIDAGVIKAAASFKVACNDSDYFSDFLKDIEILVKVVHADVDFFLADGIVPIDPAKKEQEYSEKEMAALRERIKLQSQASQYSLLQLKELEESKKIEQEKLDHERLVRKEKELLMKTPGKQSISKGTSSPALLNAGSSSKSSSPAPAASPSTFVSSSASSKPDELLKDLERMKLQERIDADKALSAEKAKPRSSSPPPSNYNEHEEARQKSAHRFNEEMITMPTKCKFCQDHILFGKALKCERCNVIVHRKCVTPKFNSLYGCRETY